MNIVLAAGSSSAGAAASSVSGSSPAAASSPIPSSSSTSPAPGPSVLTWGQTSAALIIIALALLAVGGVIVYARSHTGQHATTAKPSIESSASVVRSWIAVSLVVGLLLFSALTFAVDDETLRSTLIGALTASVGSAIAYYFSTKAAEQAQQNVLVAAGTEVVPNLKGKSETDASAALGATSLKLEIDPSGSKDPNAKVSDQVPTAGATVHKASSVRVTLTV